MAMEVAAAGGSLLGSISEFCRLTGMAESTFGRRAVNDGKFVARLRDGARVTPETLQRVNQFISRHGHAGAGDSPPELLHLIRASAPQTALPAQPREAATPEKNFRFFDNRQKYLLFVNTCSEKEVVARRVGLELGHIHPRPPAIRLFDAGMGDGTVLARVMREMHRRFATVPFYVVGKEISLEDVRLSLRKMADRFFEHPATVLVVTNMYYTEAPWLTPRAVAAATSMVWHEQPLTGTTSHEFGEQIAALEPFLARNWQARHSPKTGNPVYENPVALILYRDDYRFLLNDVLPKRGEGRADYDMVIASQPYRLRAPLEFKAQKVIGPLVRGLGKGGRLLGIHSHGADPGLEIVEKVWPGENPFQVGRHELLQALKEDLGADAEQFDLTDPSDEQAIFRYQMHTLPSEIGDRIGTSTLFAAWNAVIYVNQIEDERLDPVVTTGAYLDATQEVLHKHGGLWFNDEAFVVTRK